MALMTAEKREVGTVGTQQVQAFSIKANGKAFKVLIDGLYSDKIRSVIREIWTNAYDAHVMADNSAQPFECQLPTIFDPSFRVRDYGISMTHHGVMHLYSTVFESSKESTNEQVGKLGLGSKSPFAYTDTFTVTAWLDGEKRTYSAFIGSDYVPQIAHMMTEPSDEPEGIEVSFPVKMGDIEAFRSAAERVIIGFETRPNIIGQKLSDKPLEEHMRGNNWVLYKQTWGATITSAHARQGCVLYPIDGNAVQGLTSLQRSLLQSPVVIDFPIGSLEISANRESLGYDATTCANITAELDAIINTLSAEFVARIDAAETVWNALVIRKEIIEDTSVPMFVRDTVRMRKYKGFDPTVRNDYMSWKGLVRGDLHITKIDRYDMGRRQAGPKLDKFNIGPHGGIHFHPGELLVYFHDADTKVSQVAQRITKHYSGIRYEPNAPTKFLYVKARKNSIGFKRLLVKLGCPPADIFLDVSTLPEIPKEQQGRGAVKMKKIHNGFITPVDVDFDAGGYYFPLKRDAFEDVPAPFKDYKITCSALSGLFVAMKNVGAIPADAELYGVPRSLARHANKDEWINFWDIAKTFFDTHYDATKVGVFDMAKRLTEPSNYTRNSGKIVRLCNTFAESGHLPDDVDAPLGKMLTKLAELRTLTHLTPEQLVVDKYIGMTNYAVPLLDMDKYKTDIYDLADAVYSTYPMLEIAAEAGSAWAGLLESGVKDVSNKVLDYVNLVDSQA